MTNDKRGPYIDVRLICFESHHPKNGQGKLATFDVSLGGFITVRGISFHRGADGNYKMITPRLEKTEKFSVEMPKWLRRAIQNAAAAALRGIGHDIPHDFMDSWREPAAVIPEPADRTRYERPDAGLRRAIGETMRKAGL